MLIFRGIFAFLYRFSSMAQKVYLLHQNSDHVKLL